MRMKRLLPLMSTLLLATNLLAQTTTATPEDAASPGDAAVSAAGLFALGGCWLFSCVGGLAFWLVTAIWVMRDAKRRNSPNATLVTVLAWIPATTMIGLIVHLVTRPKTIAGPGNPPL